MSLAALKEAKGLFFPSIGIESRYTRAGGGRMIEIPIGDLMNPLGEKLNKLLALVGQPPSFPTNMENEIVPFLREEEHETKIRVMQPVFHPALFYNMKLRKNIKDFQETEQNIYTRHLVCDIKIGYFNYLKTVQVVRLYEKTRKLLEENVRVSERLFENEKVTRAAVYRASAELYGLELKQEEAQKHLSLSRAYFNFLLNRPLDQLIEILSLDSLPPYSLMTLDEAQSEALQKRDEFRQLEEGIQAIQNKINLSKTNFLPGVSLVADYGYQGEEYRFSNEDDYWMASLILHWNLFNGFQDKSKVIQSKMEKKESRSKIKGGQTADST